MFNLPIRHQHLCMLAAASACFAMLTGCSPGRPSSVLSGTVYYKDKSGKQEPLPGGMLQLRFANGERTEVPITSAGSFTATNAPIGRAEVAISNKNVKLISKEPDALKKSLPDPSKMSADEKAKFQAVQASMPKADPNLKYVPIADRFASFEKSELTWDIGPGNNKQDFVVESK